MAGGMVLMGILLALLPVEHAMVIHGVSQLSSNVSRALLSWRSTRWEVVGWYALGAAGVLGLLAALDLALDRAAALVALGLMPSIPYLLPQAVKLSIERPADALVCGASCMGVQMLCGVSGPLLDAFFAHSHMTRHEVISTKAATQVLSHAARIAFFGTLLSAANESIDWVLALLLPTSAIIGTAAAKLVLQRITDANFRLVTRRLVLVLAACYLVAGLSLLSG